jgi:hypothetical protein
MQVMEAIEEALGVDVKRALRRIGGVPAEHPKLAEVEANQQSLMQIVERVVGMAEAEQKTSIR